MSPALQRTSSGLLCTVRAKSVPCTVPRDRRSVASRSRFSAKVKPGRTARQASRTCRPLGHPGCCLGVAPEGRAGVEGAAGAREQHGACALQIVQRDREILGELDRAGVLNTAVPTVYGDSLAEALDSWDIMRNPTPAVVEFFKAGPGGVRTQQAFSQSARWPSLDASGAASRARGYDFLGNEQTTTQYNGSLAAGYELDVWGKLGATARAAAHDYQATRLDVEVRGEPVGAVGAVRARLDGYGDAWRRWPLAPSAR